MRFPSPHGRGPALRLAALMLILLAGCSTHPRTVPWWSSSVLQPGPRSVGVDVQLLTDGTRGNGAGQPRLLQVVTWYPSEASPGTPMDYAGYLQLADSETLRVSTPDRRGGTVDGLRAFLVSRGTADSVVESWFHAPMLAARDAKPAAGRFPMVLIAQGNGESAADQCVLGEFLASHGFVVATCPSQSRITGEPSEESKVAAAAEDQADDLALMQRAVAQRADAASGGVAIVAHSFGARSALYEAMRDSTVRGIVSLDGGIGSSTAREAYESGRLFRPAAMRAPILHVYETLDPQMAPDWAILKSLPSADVWLAKAADLHHHHFTVLGAASGRYADMARVTGATPHTGDSYAAVLEWTLAFLVKAPHVDASTFAREVPAAPGIRPERLSP